MAAIMRMLHVRVTVDQHESLKAKSVAEDRPMSAIVRELLAPSLETRQIEEIRTLLAQARSLGPVSKEAALAMAKRVAKTEVEDYPDFGEGSDEGFGKVTLIRED